MSEIKVLYDEKTGIYKSDYAPLKSNKLSFYNRVMGEINFEEEVPAFIECSSRLRSITNSSIKLQAQQLGLGLLQKAGLKPGDVVMLVCSNCIEFPIVLLASAFAGLKIALANPAYSSSELYHVISITKPQKIFLKSSLLRKLIVAKVPWNKFITIDTSIGRGAALYMKDIMASKEDAIKAKAIEPINLNETQILPFSSGTTGLPKSVEVTHRNLVAMLDSLASIPNGITSIQRHLAVLPFYHAYALLMNVLLPITARATVWISPTPFNPVKYCEIVQREKIQGLCMVPPLFIALGNCPQATKKEFDSVRWIMCGAAPLDADTQIRLENRLGVPVRGGWGMTETTVAGLGCHEDIKIGTCGKPVPGIEAKCVDMESGEPTKRGERGELWVRGSNIVKGYFQNEKATKETITEDGWLKTGDVAVVDEDGNFSIVDRIKELIKVKGSQVAPAELEGLLLTHPKIASVAVVGVYDKSQATEWPRAYIELKDGRKSQEEEAKLAKEFTEYVKKKASHPKQLKGGVRFLDKVPCSPSGKLLRKDLRALVKQEEESPSAHL